jgi:hypothetical protein
MKAKLVKIYSRQLVQSTPEVLYVFGDNLQKSGTGGQAVIRGIKNTFGIPTKKFPCMEEDCFFTDDEYEENCRIISAYIRSLLNFGTAFLIVAFPEDGLGTGLAQLNTRAPRTYQFLVDSINANFENVYGN